MAAYDLVTDTENKSWVEAVRKFLQSQPQGLPDELQSILEEAIDGSHRSLPPRVFFEAVQQSAVAISITDIKAHILYANPAFTRITGYEADEVIGNNESILSDKKTPKHIYEDLWKSLLMKKAWSGTLINRRKDGVRYIADLTIAPVVNGAGEISHYLGMHRDVTEEHRLAQEVLNSKELIESVVDAAPVVIALLDAQGKLVRTNQAYRQLAQEMDGDEPVDNLWGTLLQQGGTKPCSEFTDFEVRYDPGGATPPRWFSCSCTEFQENDTSAESFFESNSQIYRLLVAKEITEIKKGQEAVRMNALRALMAEEDLVQSTRETLAGAIYQLQGPLNLVAAAGNLLERRGSSVNLDSLRRVLRDAMSSGAEALDTLRRCMPESPVEAVAPVNINELLHDVLAMSTNRLLANGIIVDWQPTSVLPAINGRQHRLRSMFNQLIENAIDAMSDRRMKLRELTIHTRQSDDDVVTISIDDTGPGIPEEERLHVFQPFYTTKGMRGKRAGMGLAMVQDVVSEHGGAIHIGTSGSGGCRMEIQLPVDAVAMGGDA